MTMRRHADAIVDILRRASGIVDEHGNVHSPKDGKFAPRIGGMEWPSNLKPSDVQHVVSARHPGVELAVYPSHGGLHLSLIRVPENERGKGKAQAAMKDLTAAADRLGLRILLTPEPLPGDRKTKKAQLTAWYKSHGFVENKGSNKDYEITAAMYREPQTRT